MDKVKKNRSILDFLEFREPTFEQKEALNAMADLVSPSNKKDFLILSGAAGTGKLAN